MLLGGSLELTCCASATVLSNNLYCWHGDDGVGRNCVMTPNVTPRVRRGMQKCWAGYLAQTSLA